MTKFSHMNKFVNIEFRYVCKLCKHRRVILNEKKNRQLENKVSGFNITGFIFMIALASH
jgi:hypothetical protein